MSTAHIVIYHGHCTDGFGAAYFAWRLLGSQGVEYHEAHYGDVNSPEQFVQKFGDPAGKRVHVLDFSFPRPVMDWLMGDESRTAGIVWLDHHKTAFEMWLGGAMTSDTQLFEAHGRNTIILDNNKSGALLSKNYYLGVADDRPLANYIDDRDRWQFKLDGSRDIHAYLQSRQPWDFRTWAEIEARPMEQVKRMGAVINAEWARQINDLTKRPNPCLLASRTNPETGEMTEGEAIKGLDMYWTSPGLAINSPIHQSEIGNALAKLSGTYGLVWSILPGEMRVRCSVRSIGDYDVSAIAKFYGGGGHKNAAGFNIPLSALADILKPAIPV